MKDENCIYHKKGNCTKGLADTPCELSDCVAHIDKTPQNTFIEKAIDWLRRCLDNGMWVDQFLSNYDKDAIIQTFKEWMEDENCLPPAERKDGKMCEHDTYQGFNTNSLMKVKKENNHYIIEAGKREYLLLLKAVDFGAAWMDENGYSEDERNILILLEKLKKVKE